MKMRNALQVTGLSFGLFMVPASPSEIQTLGIVTLASPNEQAAGLFGVSVSDAGDVNQDGFADVIVAALLEDSGTGLNAGRAYMSSAARTAACSSSSCRPMKSMLARLAFPSPALAMSTKTALRM